MIRGAESRIDCDALLLRLQRKPAHRRSDFWGERRRARRSRRFRRPEWSVWSSRTAVRLFAPPPVPFETDWPSHPQEQVSEQPGASLGRNRRAARRSESRFHIACLGCRLFECRIRSHLPSVFDLFFHRTTQDSPAPARVRTWSLMRRRYRAHSEPVAKSRPRPWSSGRSALAAAPAQERLRPAGVPPSSGARWS